MGRLGFVAAIRGVLIVGGEHSCLMRLLRLMLMTRLMGLRRLMLHTGLARFILLLPSMLLIHLIHVMRLLHLVCLVSLQVRRYMLLPRNISKLKWTCGILRNERLETAS